MEEKQCSNIVYLDVGGKIFKARTETLMGIRIIVQYIWR